MQHLEVSGAVRPIWGSLGVKWLIQHILRQMIHKIISQGVAHLMLNNVHVPRSHIQGVPGGM